MLTQFEVMETVDLLNRVGLDATSHAIRRMLGGTHKKLLKITAGLASRGLLLEHSRRHRPNCESRCYSLTALGERVASAVSVKEQGYNSQPGN